MVHVNSEIQSENIETLEQKQPLLQRNMFQLSEHLERMIFLTLSQIQEIESLKQDHPQLETDLLQMKLLLKQMILQRFKFKESGQS